MVDSLVDQRFPLEELLDLPTLREVIEAFATCFSVCLLVVDDKCNELVRQGPQHSYCQQIRETLGKGARCEEVENKILQHPITGTSAIQVQAFCGLKYAAFPLLYQFDLMGRVVIGPYRDEQSSPERLIQNVSQQEQIKKSLEKIPVIKADLLKNISRLLAKTLDAFIFINAKRLVTTHMHLEAIMQQREHIFRQIEKESGGSPEAKRNIEKLKQMF